jgi:hypothetical protein
VERPEPDGGGPAFVRDHRPQNLAQGQVELAQEMRAEVRRRLEAIVAVHQPRGVNEERRWLTADEQQQTADLTLTRVRGHPAVRHRPVVTAAGLPKSSKWTLREVLERDDRLEPATSGMTGLNSEETVGTRRKQLLDSCALARRRRPLDSEGFQAQLAKHLPRMRCT